MKQQMLSLFHSSYVKELKDRLPSLDIGEFYGKRPTFEFDPTKILPTRYELAGPAPALEVPADGAKAAKSDLENAKKVYEYLGPLSETLAADSRLWTCLTHTVFFDYTRRRWPVESKTTWQSVQDHWFLNGAASRALRRNSIARLWWAAHLTKSPWERPEDGLEELRDSDDYKYTELLLRNQDIYQQLLERSFGWEKKVLVCTLDALSQVRITNYKAVVQGLSKELNLHSATCDLGSLPTSELRALILGMSRRAAEAS